ncbi:MAG: hypothetical protein N2235_25195 [Fischerella sp.]|nr:hypothetical protein [Fischerella sp.]
MSVQQPGGLPKQLCGICSWRFRAEALTTNNTYPAILVWWSTRNRAYKPSLPPFNPIAKNRASASPA